MPVAMIEQCRLLAPDGAVATACLLAAVAAALILLPAPVDAAAVGSTTFAVNVTVNATCQVSTTNMAFGGYSGVQLDATGTVTVTCTKSTGYSVGINTGANGTGGNFGWRLIGPGGAYVPYSVYKDSGRTSLWGGTVGSDTVDATGTGSPVVTTAYGRVAANIGVTPGAYTDTLTFTLYY